MKQDNTFQPSVAFRIGANSLICNANPMTGFYLKCITGLKRVNKISLNLLNANSTKWSTTLKQSVGFCRQIV